MNGRRVVAALRRFAMRSLVLALVVIAMSAASADACSGGRCRLKGVRTKATNVVRWVLPPYGR